MHIVDRCGNAVAARRPLTACAPADPDGAALVGRHGFAPPATSRRCEAGVAQRQRQTLTEKQVLRWIADGCTDGMMADQFHRISAAALRSRGLVTTSGRGSTWTAKVTAAGTEYLRDADGQNPPVPRQANVSVTQQLVDDVIAAGGSLRVPRKGWYAGNGVDYENRARLAERYRKGARRQAPGYPHGRRRAGDQP